MGLKFKNKIFIFGIISILLLMVIPQNTIASTIDIDNEKQEDYQVSPSNNEKGEWKTNYFCRVRVYTEYACGVEPEWSLGFIRNARIWGSIFYCTIVGLNGTDVYDKSDGKLDLRVEYLFGFTFDFFQSWLSYCRLGGFAFKCKYKVY